MFGSKPSISDYYRAIDKQIEEQILRENDDIIIGTATNELVEYYLQDLPQPIEIDTERDENMDFRKDIRRIPAHQRERGYESEGDLVFEYESIIITIPIIQNSHISKLKELGTSTMSMSWSPDTLRWSSDSVSFVLDIKGYGFKHDDNQVQNNVKFQKDRVYEWIGWIRNDVEKENTQIRNRITSFIEVRKQKISEDKERMLALVNKINIPLKKKESEITKRIQLDQKPLVTKVRPNPKLPEEYILDTAKVLDVISIIDNQGRQFEKTPHSFQNSEEEDLRNIILIGLNGLFEGKATGETFSTKGKTDIYLNIDQGNILIAECKFWGGKKLYEKTIEQLFGYLTWRNNFGIMISFVKVKDFSKILQGIEEIIKGHSSYKGGFKKLSDTHFVSNHSLAQDEDKHVEVHHLFYNLYLAN